MNPDSNPLAESEISILPKPKRRGLLDTLSAAQQEQLIDWLESYPAKTVLESGKSPAAQPLDFSAMLGHSAIKVERKQREARNEWGKLVPDDQWHIYNQAIEIARANKIDFMLGGAFGLAGYTGRWRNTKDLDFFVLPEVKDRFVQGLLRAGFEDYYDRLPYDRGWIFRSIKNDVLVDVIWATPNRRTLVDQLWFPNATEIELCGEGLHLAPLEEILWVKMYVLQKDRCDWPDLLNLLYAQVEAVDWEHLFGRLGDDLPLLAALLQVFAWLCPTRSKQIPEPIRTRLGILDSSGRGGMGQQDRVNLLDSRPWFAALQPSDRPMQL